MVNILGETKNRKRYARAFNEKKSNFKIDSIVDMWITGFDVPSMDTMYLDKPQAENYKKYELESPTLA